MGMTSMLIDRAAVHAFAVQWRDYFVFPQLQPTVDADAAFGDACAAVGFTMDRGVAFAAAYGQRVPKSLNAAEWPVLLQRVRQIRPLGNLLFSRWRLLTHQLETSLMADANRRWFIDACARLAIITEPIVPLARLALTTYAGEFGVFSAADVVSDQELVIDADGHVALIERHADGATARVHWRVATQQLTPVLAALNWQLAEYDGTAPLDADGWRARVITAGQQARTCDGALGVIDDQALRHVLHQPQLCLFSRRPKDVLVPQNRRKS